MIPSTVRPGTLPCTSAAAAAVVAALAVLAAAPGTARALSGAAMLVHASDYAQHKWTMKSSNVKGWCSGSYASDYAAGSYTGVAYDWGGWDTLASYDQKLGEGYGAGSHSWHGILECTTGVDCSGYVSRCWELAAKQTTSTMNTVSHPIQKKEVSAGDAYNKPGSHIVLWVKTASDGSPVFYEASGSASKVRLNSAASWSYLSGYSPIRYDGWESGGSVTPMSGGTKEKPIVIETFPFHHEASTLQSTSDTIDAYACAPATGEKGPEVFYKVLLAKQGTLTAKVTDGPGVDVDPHLLSGPTSTECIQRGDVTVSATLDPGTYWLVLDSWSDQSGVAYGGEYELDVTFSPSGGQATTPQDGTLGKPFVISAFPYHHSGDTSAKISDAIDVYACAPETSEKGPEVLYTFTVNAGGKCKASVTDGPGVDVDLHLLWAPDPQACLARNDKAIDVSVGPGTYWLVLDSWASSDGAEYPGPFELDVTFKPASACTPSCAGKQCGPDGCFGWCGTCPAWTTCNAGKCVASETCGDGECVPGVGEGCDVCPADCPCGCGQTCVANVCTLTACAGRTCGPDGCGGWCGQCQETEFCDRGSCVPLLDTSEKEGDCTGDECNKPLEVLDVVPWEDGMGPPYVVEGTGWDDGNDEAGSSSGCALSGTSPDVRPVLALLVALVLTASLLRTRSYLQCHTKK